MIEMNFLIFFIGKLASAGFPQDHFTHLFIDEAG